MSTLRPASVAATDRPLVTSPVGPWLVGLGAALWGTESAFRIPLLRVFSADAIVLLEQLAQLLLLVPVVVACRAQFRRRYSRAAFGYIFCSGVLGSAVGAVFFTEALKAAAEGGTQSNTSVVNVVLNIQPVFSTIVARVLFREQLTRKFYLWAPLAIASGVALAIDTRALAEGAGFSEFVRQVLASMAHDRAILYALACALGWGLGTVAGRGAMKEMPAVAASTYRLAVGFVTMFLLVAVRGELRAEVLLPQGALRATSILWLVSLSSISGVIPLWVYLRGLALTRASVAGYFEMLQTLAGLAITWGVFGDALSVSQVLAGVALVGCVAMLQRAQSDAEDRDSLTNTQFNQFAG